MNGLFFSYFFAGLVFLLLCLLLITSYLIPLIMHRLFFLNFVKKPYANYENLTANNIESIGRNFYFNVKPPNDNSDIDCARIGVWHILPASISKKFKSTGVLLTNNEIENLLNTDKHLIVIYFHGNTFDRTTSHRCNLYNFLSNMDFHIIAIDYRGFGDSDGLPTEDGLVTDAKAIYEYVREKAPSKKIIIWGHSMGTAVATRATSEFSIVKNPPNGLILESPFNNLHDVIYNHPLSYPFRNFFFFKNIFIDPLKKIGLKMDTDIHITEVECPILILHAVDDHIIPVKLARKLVQVAKKANRNVEFIEFDASREFKHKFIYQANELNHIVTKFLTKI